eukprot:gnl/Chilomastix_cuspidata/3549.p1 GENE.gnl/Chilomastix_cuspidata/3549~~gnl/Chilomastix_cuspidata/3549.p1  ORF type:complete len:766 (+),score=398.43 gnl/Chilomastix_cuspidata/3549:37-2298(+)
MSYLTPDFIREVYTSICKDTDEQPSQEGLVWFRSTLGKGSNNNELVARSCRLGINAAMTLAKRCDGIPIQKLDIFDNLIRDIGMMAIIQLVHDNPHISTLNLGANDIGMEGAMALSEELKTNRSLTQLELGTVNASMHDNYIDSEGVAAISLALRENRTLRYLGLAKNLTGRGSDEGARLLGEALATNSALESLDIRENQLTDPMAEHIIQGVARSSLKKLNLADNSLTSAFSSILPNFLSMGCPLYSLNLSGNPIGPSAASDIANAVAACPTLKVLKVANCGLGDYGGYALMSGLYSVEVRRSFHPDDCKDLSGPFANDILNLSMIAGTTDEDKKFVFRRPRGIGIEILDIAGNKLKGRSSFALANFLLMALDLRTLTLSNNSFGNEGAQELARALSYADILPEGAVVETRLKRRHVSPSVEPDGGIPSRPAFRLRTLRLDHCRIGPEVARPLADALARLPRLLSLALNGNFFDEASGDQIVDALAASRTLVAGNLAGNQLSYTSMRRFFELLQKNRVIRDAKEPQQLRARLEKFSEIEDELKRTLGEIELERVIATTANSFAATAKAKVAELQTQTKALQRSIRSQIEDQASKQRQYEEELAQKRKTLADLEASYTGEIAQLKAQLDAATREHAELEAGHAALVEKERSLDAEHEARLAEYRDGVRRFKDEYALCQMRIEENLSKIENLERTFPKLVQAAASPSPAPPSPRAKKGKKARALRPKSGANFVRSASPRAAKARPRRKKKSAPR